MLQLTFSEDGILRFFLRGWFSEFEKGVQIRFVNIEIQCFIFPSRGKDSD